ncbi:lamin tail domain-containing protein 1 isoform X3 [Alligator mississippiensis]|uniref:lamin tail domain-containing protein 1 isoform X3 n=1 Tax=Alligator mississippiensis TaxID=8496 RepID=UPI002877FF08|nr:lamin tail domain-containing protein 1 isoform X3 [Alligator mississippiensis]
MINGTTTATRLSKSPAAVYTIQERDSATSITSTSSAEWSCPNCICPSPATSISDQCQEDISSSCTDLEKNTQLLRHLERTPSAAEDYNISTSSALGNLRIGDVHPGGHFVKILNSSPVIEESIGDYILQKNANGQAVAVFRFPPNIRMSANSTVTVWAVDANVLHKPPSDFFWKEQNRLRTDLDCTTILCEPSGQAVAWCTPMYWNRKLRWKGQEDSEHLKNNTKPTKLIKQQRKSELRLSDIEQEEAVQGQPKEKGPIFIKREKKAPATLVPTQNSWCQSPNSSTHPHFSLVRPLTMGNDGSSLCRQSRCQSAKPDPAPGTLYAGSSHGRSTTIACSHEKSSRRSTRSAGPNLGGVMYVGSAPTSSALQKYFVPLAYNFRLPTQASFTPSTFT